MDKKEKCRLWIQLFIEGFIPAVFIFLVVVFAFIATDISFESGIFLMLFAIFLKLCQIHSTLEKKNSKMD